MLPGLDLKVRLFLLLRTSHIRKEKKELNRTAAERWSWSNSASLKHKRCQMWTV